LLPYDLSAHGLDGLVEVIEVGETQSCAVASRSWLVSVLEIATALRNDIRVIPVLLLGAARPAADRLPYELEANTCASR